MLSPIIKGPSFHGTESNHNVIVALAPAQRISTDVNSNSSDKSNSIHSDDISEKLHWACHKEVLKNNSNYFNAIFNSEFQEAEASVIFLPRGIFGPAVLDDVIYFMYSKSIKQDHVFESNEVNLERLEHLEAIYLAADYLSMEELCLAVQQEIIRFMHGLICYCDTCTFLMPHLLSFTGSNQHNYPSLNNLTELILKLLTQDPEKTLPSYWSNENLGFLFAETKDLHKYLEAKILEHVNKNNAIETVHGCFLASEKRKDRVSEKKGDHWSPLICTQTRIQQASSKLLADHLEYYCTKYPELLSCVDGITYTFEFLDYLFSSILSEINEYNACLIYKSIIRHLINRDSVQQNTNVKSILQTSKSKSIRFIALNLNMIKKLDLIDKTIVEPLAQDLVVPINTLLVEYDSKVNNKLNHHQHKKSVPSINQSSLKWDRKVRSRFFTMMFGQSTLHFKVGQRVQLTNRPVETFGTISYVGKLEKHNDQFLGVELDRSVGSSDGSLDGKRYFITSPNRGIFVKPSQVILV